MIITEIIEKKHDGQVLKPEEIDFMINGLVNGEVADYQMTSFMMAVCCRGMNETETAALTKAMIDSGNTIDLSDVPGIKVDKHSTGGVGDTTTLVVAPLVAACGGTVAKMSGRGLAHSGGTLDKLESVPGVCVEQPLERFKQIVRDIGLCVIGQSADLDPADKRMYALRDVSGTVKSIPLIASSIMSKKLASGTDAIVLDVKTGNGAFMEKIEEAVELGAVADNFDERIEQKIFHCEIVVDNEKVKRETARYVKLPQIIDFTDKDGNDRMQEEIQANYERIRQEVRQIVEDEITRIKNDPELCHLIKEEEE